MSKLTETEQETAKVLREASIGELSGNALNFQSLGFKDNKLSEEGVETQRAMQDVNNVAYKIMQNTASDLSKAKVKMNDIATRYGRDNKTYDEAQGEYNAALTESQDAVQRYEITKNTRNRVATATVKGLTL